jgi:hypothetical protein
MQKIEVFLGKIGVPKFGGQNRFIRIARVAPPRPEGGLVLKKSTPPAIAICKRLFRGSRPLGEVTPNTT